MTDDIMKSVAVSAMTTPSKLSTPTNGTMVSPKAFNKNTALSSAAKEVQTPPSLLSPKLLRPLKFARSPSPSPPPSSLAINVAPQVPADVIMPVSPHSPLAMIGAQRSMHTGITYPVNVWGPISKYGYLDEVPPTWVQRQHFGGKHDKLAKQRLQARRFCYMRHPRYKSIIEPDAHPKNSLFLNPKRKEFWRTDVEAVLHKEADQRKARQKELLEMWKNEEGLRRSELVRDRDDRYQAFLDLEKNLKDHPGFRNNKTGCCYDIFTHKCDEGHEGQKLIYKDEMRKWKATARALFIQSKTSATRPYNIINWLKSPPCRVLGPKPKSPPPTPPPKRNPDMILLNTSKGVLSFAHPLGPFGSLP
ncbi:hypothetical protein BDL97_01G103800 [Sphagnum fallax]|nr:hypothetical protein BDL97_01G103800 [Sphagnum fallax]